MPSPQYCPVCGERTWSSEETTSGREEQRRYKLHLQGKHPEYERWIKKIALRYFAITMTAVLIPFIILYVTLTGLSRIYVGVLVLPVTLVMGGVDFLLRRRGTKRFRDLWGQEHGALTNR